MGTSRKEAKLREELLDSRRRTNALHLLLNKHQWVLANLLNDLSEATGGPPIYTCKMDVAKLANGTIKLDENFDERIVTAAWYPKEEPLIVAPNDPLAHGILKLIKP